MRPFTVYDAIAQSVEGTLERMAEDPNLRRALFEPRIGPNVAMDERSTRAIADGLRALEVKNNPAVGLARLRQQLRRNQHCITSGRLVALASLERMSLNSTVALGDRPLVTPIEGPGARPAWRLEANNHVLLLPPEFEDALQQLALATGPLRLDGLKGLEDANKLILGKLLVRHGVGIWLDPSA